MLSPAQAYKLGFFTRCLSVGVPLEQVPALAKQASDLLEKQGTGTIYDAAKTLLTLGTGIALPLAIAAPPVAGAFAGHALGKMTDLDDTDVADIKSQELLDEYHRQTQKLRQESALRAGHHHLAIHG